MIGDVVTRIHIALASYGLNCALMCEKLTSLILDSHSAPDHLSGFIEVTYKVLLELCHVESQIIEP
jgi:hypothetical protein